ncbi:MULTISPECIES: hypothetical protein [unclassified Variovorax]|uniref:hypothetical protein n=1 Tax=unclassified Variovorax TaxID=663243 RepID=UPI001BD5FDEF|nr:MULTISPECIES: hypothetical protein [unclassified Variovorax]
MNEPEFIDKQEDLKKYVDLKVDAKSIKWKILSLPESSGGFDVPGRTDYLSLIVVIESNEMEIKKLQSRAVPKTTRLIPVPAAFLKNWLPRLAVDAFSGRNFAGKVTEINEFASLKDEAFDAIAISGGSQIVLYVGYVVPN